jgi:hypothetical protein
MSNSIIRILFLTVIISFYFLFCNSALAWQHEIAAGYGYGQEIEEDYHNQGYEISGKFYKFPPIDNTLVFTIDGAVAYWRSSADQNRQLTTVTIAPAARAYFFNPCYNTIRPYLEVSFGPNYLSQKVLGEREQGSHFCFRTTLGGGTEIGLTPTQSLDLNLHLAHYCNAGIFKPNQGIDVLYIFTVGYQF